MSTPTFPQSAGKFRPYFTTAQLKEVIRCCKLVSADIELLKYLETFSLKINHGVIEPAIVNRPSLESRLGIGQSIHHALPGPIPPSPSELYEIWKTDPQHLTPGQVITVQQYRWENELMTPEEARSYEDSLMN